MSRHKQAPKIGSHKKLTSYAKSHGGTLSEGGNHTKVTGPIAGRPVTISRGTGDFSRGMTSSIIKQLALIGIAIITFICVFLNIISNV